MTTNPLIARFGLTRAVPVFFWWSLLGVGVMVGFCARGAWHQYRASGRFNPLYAIIAIWGVSYLAYRWHSLRRDPSAGTFSLRRFRANPARYIAGPLATTVVWVAILFVATLVVAIYENGWQPRDSRYPDSPVPQHLPGADGVYILQQAPAADGSHVVQQPDRMRQGSAAKG